LEFRVAHFATGLERLVVCCEKDDATGGVARFRDIPVPYPVISPIPILFASPRRVASSWSGRAPGRPSRVRTLPALLVIPFAAAEFGDATSSITN
jgi:hypothetical protein